MIERRKTGRRPIAARRPRRPAAPPPKVVHERKGPLHCEIVTVGRELLRGRARDANAAWLASALSRRGAIVHRLTTVDDSPRAVSTVVSEALHRGAHLIVTTGGLGPASDDRTLAGVADALQLPLARSAPAIGLVEAAYARLEKARQVARPGLSAARTKMGSIPLGAIPIENEAGIAPGALVRMAGGAAVLCLPGVPDEMRRTFAGALTHLKDLLPAGEPARRDVETPTRDESSLRPILDRVMAEHPAVWITTRAPGFGRRRGNVVVSIESFAANLKEAESLVDAALRRLLSLAGGGR